MARLLPAVAACILWKGPAAERCRVMPQYRGCCAVRTICVQLGVDELRFEWDPAKDRRNRQKHGIAFAEAQTAFADDDAILLADAVHSTDEERFYLLGLSARLRLLVVIHCYRADDGVIRLISARKATSSQRAQYAARWKR